MLANRVIMGSGADASIAYLGSATDTNNNETTKSATIALPNTTNGFCVVAYRQNDYEALSQTVSSASIDGQGATVYAFKESSFGSSSVYTMLLVAPATANATGTVSVTWSSGSHDGGAFSSYHLTGHVDGVPDFTATASGTGGIADLGNSGGEAVVAAVLTRNDASSNTLTGVTEDHEASISDSLGFAGQAQAGSANDVSANLAIGGSGFAATNTAWSAAAWT